MSNDLHTLSGAYALDALSDEEAHLFDTHLEQCQACRDEVRELREVAAKLCASEANAVPPGLRARVLAAADQQPQLPPKVTPNVTPIGVARSRRWRPQLVAAVAAAVLVLAVGIGVLQSQRDESSVMATTVSQVFQAPDARTKTVVTDHGKLTVAASPTLGRMAVETDGLQPLNGGKVYQMWAIHSGTSTSVGLVEDLAAGKAMAMPSTGTEVAITVEPAGGSEQPTSAPIVTLDPETV
jgi:anti-sigma-K factor RskA